MYKINSNIFIKIIPYKIMTFKKLRFLGRGKRSEVYVFKKNNKLYCIKFKRKDSKAVGRLENEAKFLILLNKYKIGPKLIAYGSDFIVYEFVNGNFFIEQIGLTVDEKRKKDQQRKQELINKGYKILEFWEHDIRHNPEIIKKQLLGVN